MLLTTKQKQCLLAYLGYYEDEIDGIWGKASKEATKDFQKASGLEADGDFGPNTKKAALKAVYDSNFKEQAFDSVEIETPTDSGWNGGSYFVKSEFACKCGGKYCNGYPVEPEYDLIEIAVTIRKHYGVPVIITSGIRCEKHNANVGGVWNSRHLKGKAMDLYVTGRKANEVLAFVITIPGVRYAYAIDSDHIHVDIN